MTEHTYKQAPYQDCTKQQYKELLAKMPTDVDWDCFSDYEKEDLTGGSQEFACTANSCEIVDFPSIIPLVATP